MINKKINEIIKEVDKEGSKKIKFDLLILINLALYIDKNSMYQISFNKKFIQVFLVL